MYLDVPAKDIEIASAEGTLVFHVSNGSHLCWASAFFTRSRGSSVWDENRASPDVATEEVEKLIKAGATVIECPWIIERQ